jgi:hypothetical protein
MDVYIPPMPITLNNLKELMQTAIANTDQPLLQNVWHKVKYHLDVCRATNGAHGLHLIFVAIPFLLMNLCNRSYHW